MRGSLPYRLIAVVSLTPLLALGQESGSGPTLASVQDLLDRERPEAALQLLRALPEEGSTSARALLLTSTAHFMLGNIEQGRAALARSLELDPDQRQAWLHQAALDLSEERYDDALAAFRRARELDPAATDNDINLGATLILMGDVSAASRHFNDYLRENRSSAEAYYLVATNYAMGGYFELAVRHLEAAIQLDEKSRRRSRTDPNFGPLVDYQPFQALLARDGHLPVPGTRVRTEVFSAAYDGGRGKLLQGLLSALQLSGRPFDPEVEVTEEWALVWSDVRLKLGDAPEGAGRIEMTAPATSMSAEAFRNRTDELVAQVREQLALLSLHGR